MSSIQDPEDPNPRGGDGPNKGDLSGSDSVSSASGEHLQDEGRGDRLDDEEAPQSSSKGINPVQHSE